MTISLVTGANRGIGHEVALQLAALGHHVLLGCRTPSSGEPVAEAIRASGGEATVIAVDLADADSVAAAAEDE